MYLKHSFVTSHWLDEKMLPLPTDLACMPAERENVRATHNWFSLETLTEKIALTASRHFAWSDTSGFGPALLI